MEQPDPLAVQIVLSVIFVIVSAYTAGRMHQWYRHSLDRDDAYREGYQQASRSLFPLAVRTWPARPDRPGITSGPIRRSRSGSH